MSNSTAPVVLCVDGEHTALWVRALLLSIAGYRVFTAPNGGDALRMFRLNLADVAIIDLWRPECTGTEVAAEMKRTHPKVPVILLSGLVDPPLGFEKADLILTKGIAPPEFLAAIDSIVANSPRLAAEGE